MEVISEYKEAEIVEEEDLTNCVEIQQLIFDRLPLSDEQRNMIIEDWDGNYVSRPKASDGLKPQGTLE